MIEYTKTITAKTQSELHVIIGPSRYDGANIIKTVTKLKERGIETTECENFSQWVYYMMNAEYIITDSFHGTCLALIFNKPFIVFPRATMNTRFETLLKTLGLYQRFLAKEVDALRAMAILFTPIDWDEVNAKLSEWRETGLSFLKNALTAPKGEKSAVVSRSDFTILDLFARVNEIDTKIKAALRFR
jgi:hypothetical protein